MKWFLLLGVSVAAAGAASWRLVAPGPPPAASLASPTPVSSGPRAVQGLGYVEPVSEVRKLMMRTGGVIKKCYCNVGDFIHQGEVILELEDATQQAEGELARTNLKLARAEADHVSVGTNPYRLKVVERTLERLREKLRHCQSEVERYKTLLPSGGVSRQQYDAAKSLHHQTEVEVKEHEAELLHLQNVVTPEHRAMLEAQVQAAQARLELAQARLQETRLLAPFNGTILKVLKREGEGVRQLEPEPVILFGDESRLRVRAEIDERHVQHVAVGQAAVVSGRNLSGKRYPGRVAYRERIMGDKTVFTRASSERKDLDVLQVILDMEPGFQAPTGLLVDVTILIPRGPER